MRDETIQLMEDRLVKCLHEMDLLEPGTKERGALEREAMELAQMLQTINHDNLEYWDKEDRRAVEREKTEAAKEMETEKQKMSWIRVALEIGKIVVPVVVPMIAYDKFQKRLMKFEETGRVTSTAGRELHLPKFFK